MLRLELEIGRYPYPCPGDGVRLGYAAAFRQLEPGGYRVIVTETYRGQPPTVIADTTITVFSAPPV